MRIIISILLLTLANSFSFAESWKLDQSHTRIGFSIDHMGYSLTHGIFKTYDGNITYDRNNPTATIIDFTIQTDSITTVSTDLDAHLRKDDFFDVEKYPTMTFKSKALTMKEDGSALVEGSLTLLDKTNPVTLQLTLKKDEVSPLTKLETIGFSATTTIKRSDWGLDNMVPYVGDEVVISIDGELNRIEK